MLETLPPKYIVLRLLRFAENIAGGICEKAAAFRDGKKKSLNTGVVTFVNYNKRVVTKVSQITFAHETGHNFGSPVS